MPKFAAQSINDLRTPEANRGRHARRPFFVVAVEADDGSWFELDAESMDHARTLAKNQVDLMNARGASCWRVVKSGAQIAEMGARPFFTYFWSPPEAGDTCQPLQDFMNRSFGRRV
jgi:hypothetical protein